MSKFKDREKIVKAVREKQLFTYKRTFKILSVFLSKKLLATRKYNIFKVLKEKLN
jgi:hypothetical protein